MYSLLFLGVVSIGLALLLTPLVSNLAWRFGVVDQPDQNRKIHTVPIPRMGGVAILAAVICAYGLLLAVRLSSGAVVWDGLPLVLRLFPALAVVFGIGLVDDIFSLHPWLKLAIEIVAAILAWLGGIHVTSFAGYSFSGAIASCMLTIVWIVLCTNAINLIDGVDGLAAGVSLFAALTLLVAALINRNIPMALAVAPFAGALLGFLRYNFNPASIFLGDCGSLSLGFLLGCCSAVWSEKATTLLDMTAPMLVLAVPLLDVGLAIVRRFLRRQHIFAADQAHIHHKLLSRGLTPKRLVLVIYGLCGVSATVALVLTLDHQNYRGFVIVVVFLAVALGMQYLGYNEFIVAGRVVLGGTLRSVFSAQLALEAFEQELHPDMTLQQYWHVLSRTSPHFGFSGIMFQLDDVKFGWGIDAGWQTRIDFPGHGYINLWRESGATSSIGMAGVLFVDCVSRVFSKKLSSIEIVHYK
jgi:UDP-GlcNAc:undecaprenyl-phosphate GlcNAc-1-phosphate transferase